MNKDILNVLYQSDDNYAAVSAISIASLLENNKHLKQINIFYPSFPRMGSLETRKIVDYRINWHI